MTSMATMIRYAVAVLLGAVALAAPAAAQDTTAVGVAPETQFVLNTLLFLICGFLVMWMAAGFAMLEAGLVQKAQRRHPAAQEHHPLRGRRHPLLSDRLQPDVRRRRWRLHRHPGHLERRRQRRARRRLSLVAMPPRSDWFFQMVFVATAASIVSGILAERIRVWPFLAFTAVLTGLLYPITGAWQWGGGWLAEMGFSDFAGSTLVHSVGGWAALAGVLLLGPRRGKYGPDGRVNPMLALVAAAGDARHLHPLARLVRLQRRLTAGHGQRRRCGRDRQHLRQHQPGRGRRRARGDAPDPADVQEDRSHPGAQRRHRRPGRDHRRASDPEPRRRDPDRCASAACWWS